MPDAPVAAVTHNETAHRFEIALGRQTAVLVYERLPGDIVFVHTEVPQAMEGRGIAARLAAAGLSYARAQGLAVVPLCPFITGYLARHPEYLDLVRPDYRATIARRR